MHAARLFGLIVALSSLAPPALAAPETLIIYDGHDAQRLHCAAMLSLVAQNLGQRGLISAEEEYRARDIATAIAAGLPGSEATQKKALQQRATKIASRQGLKALLAEYRTTFSWCEREFLR